MFARGDPSRESLRVLPLCECPHLVAPIARWHFEEWGWRVPGASLETATAKLEVFLDPAALPTMLVALDGDTPLGTAALRRYEMGFHPEREFWLGSVYVDAAHRGGGLGRSLVEHLVEVAAERGVCVLFLQTERLDGGLYARLGWTPLERVTRPDGLVVLVMERRVAAPQR